MLCNVRNTISVGSFATMLSISPSFMNSALSAVARCSAVTRSFVRISTKFSISISAAHASMSTRGSLGGCTSRTSWLPSIAYPRGRSNPLARMVSTWVEISARAMPEPPRTTASPRSAARLRCSTPALG